MLGAGQAESRLSWQNVVSMSSAWMYPRRCSPSLGAHIRTSSFEEGQLDALPFETGVLAGAVCWYSIIYTPPDRLAEAFGELARVLMPGGYLLLAFQAEGEPVHRSRCARHTPAAHQLPAQRAGGCRLSGGHRFQDLRHGSQGSLNWNTKRPPKDSLSPVVRPHSRRIMAPRTGVLGCSGTKSPLSSPLLECCSSTSRSPSASHRWQRKRCDSLDATGTPGDERAWPPSRFRLHAGGCLHQDVIYLGFETAF